MQKTPMSKSQGEIDTACYEHLIAVKIMFPSKIILNICINLYQTSAGDP